MNKLGQLTLKFEKDTYRKKLEYHIGTAEEASGFTKLFRRNGLTQKDMAEHRGWIMGMKMALDLLDEDE
jgi:hypothetical protein